MRAVLPPVVVALLLALEACWAGLRGLPYDYELEAMPAVDALAAGDTGGFLARAPAYGGSLLLRAPLVLAADGLGGGTQALWTAMAVPAVLASVVLAVVLWRLLAARGRRRAAWLALAIVALNPVAALAVEIGHPEEVAGAVLCAGAALLAVRGRAVAAGILLGLAGANKPWAVVAALPVLLALPRAHLRAVMVTGVTCAAVLAPLVLAGSAAVASAQAIAVAPATIFEPEQLLWFLGEPRSADPAAWRTAPAWLGSLSHPAAVLAGDARRARVDSRPPPRRGAGRCRPAAGPRAAAAVPARHVDHHLLLRAVRPGARGVGGRRARPGAAGRRGRLRGRDARRRARPPRPPGGGDAVLGASRRGGPRPALLRPATRAALAAPARAASSGCGPGVLGPAPTT
jgi:hypothetical protein